MLSTYQKVLVLFPDPSSWFWSLVDGKSPHPVIERRPFLMCRRAWTRSSTDLFFCKWSNKKIA